MISRRMLLNASTALPVVALVGCNATGTSSVTLAQVIADVKLVEQTVVEVVPIVLPLLTTDTAEKSLITNSMQLVVADTNTISEAISLAAASPTVNNFITVVQQVANIALPLSGLPPAEISIIEAGLALLPELSAAIAANLAVPGTASVAFSRSTLVAISKYSPDDARKILSTHFATLKR